MPLPLVLAALPALAKAGVGMYQHFSGKKKAKNLVRPERTTPQATMEAVARSKYAAQGQRPGSAMARQNIGTTQAGTTSAVQKAGGTAGTTMAAALGAQQQANRATGQQDVMDAQYQQQMNTQYLRALEGLSQQQSANWEWNQAQQFQEEAGAARGLQESGMQNLFSGMGEAAGLGFMSKMGYLGQANGGNMFGNKNQGNTLEQIQANTQTNYQQAQNAVGGMQIPTTGRGANPFGLQVPWQGNLNTLSQLQPIR